jgi:hypothetical protein
MTDPIGGGLSQTRASGEGDNRIMRGGSYGESARNVRAAHRFGSLPATRFGQAIKVTPWSPRPLGSTQVSILP